MRHIFDDTTPVGRPYLTFDYTRMLPPGVTINDAGLSVSIHPSCTVPDSGSASRLSGTRDISADGKKVSQFFVGGVQDVDYIVTCLATYSDGQIEPLEGVLKVRAHIDVLT